ncbi:MAG: hypothetical protein AAGA75_03550 [Cyanobacteria bacterium P01_E01_bin.6]
MLVILMNDQVMTPDHVCQGCLMADQHGLPRWSAGKLRCGRTVQKEIDNQPVHYECQMGFRVANIE